VRKLSVPILALTLMAGGSATRAAARPVDNTAPSYDMKAQAIQDLEGLHKQFVELAGAIPEDKFTWRPEAGVRSIAEVYLHVAGTNLNFATDIGTMPAPPAIAKDYEQSTTDKAKIIEQLNQSFDYAHAAIEKMSNADFAKPIKKYGPDASLGDVVYLIVTHTHEHLGQSIAYARANNITPPWTAAAQAKQQKKAD
jgi:uncharacterized damage-inducible protein DinB